MAERPREEIVVENTVCIEDVKITLLWDLGILELQIPKTNYFYNHDYTVPMHSHEHYELTYVMDELEMIYENETCFYRGEMLVVVPPGVKHAQRRTINYKGHGSPTLQLTMKKIPVTSDISLFDILSKLFDNVYARKCPKRVAEIMANFDPDDRNSIANDRIAFSLALHEFLTIIIKSATEETEFKPNKKISDSNATRAYKIHMILSNCYRDDISVEYIAKKLGLSTRQVTRIIKSVYGKTFKEILVERRMKLAAKELAETDKNIADIASFVGYNASKGFYNAFKKYYGCLPMEYRKNKSLS